MARGILDAFKNEHHYIAEAGTGTGKTMAYLAPAIEMALTEGKRIVISTGTKNLQEQLVNKDIPFLKSLIPNFTYTCMKGRYNYACISRILKGTTEPILEGLDEAKYFDVIQKWLNNTQTGDKAELKTLPEDLQMWSHLNATTENCVGRKCEYFDDCFITRMRARADGSDIIIVNHHLFFADLALREALHTKAIPDYDYVIFDEAHLIEEIATKYFGFEVSDSYLKRLLKKIKKLPATFDKLVDRSIEQIEALWHEISSLAGTNNIYTLKSKLPEHLLDNYFVLSSLLTQIQKTFKLIEEPDKESKLLESQLAEKRFGIDFILTQKESGYVSYFQRNKKSIKIESAPIEVAELLRSKIFDKVKSCILTSATLSINGKLDFISERLGIDKPKKFIAPSVFDYQKQAILYLPPEMSEPSSPNFTRQAIEKCIEVLNITDGRAFILTTSNKSMNDLYNGVCNRINHPCLLQGQMSKTGILEEFHRVPNSVLFATTSFWEGIDIQGEKLSCVIIDKLPFSVPDDPVTEARNDFIAQSGGNAFYQYSLPEAVIALKQGFGRLIRSKKDTGVVMILDPRLKTKGYGQYFLNSLPDARVSNDIEDVRRLFI
jgi:ATP-dependent DNA helicase DinG